MITLANLDIQLCPWIPESTSELQLRICYLAHADIGIQEMPPASNRSPYIDRIVTEGGGALASYWCAFWVSHIWKKAGALVPPMGLRGSCREWRTWAMKNGLWQTEPDYGCAVIYGNAAGEAEHIGIPTRLAPILTSVEGNTSTGGTFTRNGTAVWPKEVSKSRVLGYVMARAA